MLLLASAVLAGCASMDVALSRPDTPETAGGTLNLVWIFSNRAEIRMAGLRYAGEWTDERCLSAECRTAFAPVSRYHRRHLRKGEAVLVADGQARLNCEWVRHHKAVIGNCRDDDGKVFRLRSG
jgi:hypothetical protein